LTIKESVVAADSSVFAGLLHAKNDVTIIDENPNIFNNENIDLLSLDILIVGFIVEKYFFI
jgi:hypothetical protein